MRNPALTRWLTSPDGLATRLRAERNRAGLSGTALANEAGTGWSKAKVSKIENGVQLPSIDDLEAWAQITRADLQELLDLLGQANRVHNSWAARLTSGQADNQAAYGDLVRSTKTIWNLTWDLIPGEFQTETYATAVLTQSLELHGGTLDIEAAVANRLERQSLLAIPTRRYETIIGEAALHYQVVPPDAMIEQLELIDRLARFPNIDFRIVPFHQELNLFPHASFTGFDDQVVLVELPNGELAYDQSEDITTYRSVFDNIMISSLAGYEALDRIVPVRAAWEDGLGVENDL